MNSNNSPAMWLTKSDKTKPATDAQSAGKALLSEVTQPTAAHVGKKAAPIESRSEGAKRQLQFCENMQLMTL